MSNVVQILRNCYKQNWVDIYNLLRKNATNFFLTITIVEKMYLKD